jgi:hypothetical protein
VRKQGENGYSKDFRVRRCVIRSWIVYKIANDPAWADVVLDEDCLAGLPEDGNIGDLLPTVEEGQEAAPVVGVPSSGPDPPLPYSKPSNVENSSGHQADEANAADACVDDLRTPRDSGVFSLAPKAHEGVAIAATLERARAGERRDDPDRPEEAVRVTLSVVLLYAPLRCRSAR